MEPLHHARTIRTASDPQDSTDALRQREHTGAPITRRERPRRRIARRALVAASLLVVGVIAGATLFGGASPVGHFRSAEGHTAYLDAYDEALAEGPAVSEQLTVPTDYGDVRVLHYDADDSATADADPLVLLPGTQSGAPMWTDNIPALRAQRSVYVVDLLGQPGRSVQARPIETHEDEARWLAQVINALPGDPAVMGHSLGGWLAMNLAVHEPRAAAQIIVLDPVQTFSSLSFDAIVRSIPASVPWTPRSWRDAFASWTANDAPVDEEPVADMIEAGMQHYALGTPTPTRFTDEQLAAVKAPVLLIMAGRSRMHDAASAVEAAERTLDDGTVLTYEEASHAINGEEPNRIAEDVSAFLRQN